VLLFGPLRTRHAIYIVCLFPRFDHLSMCQAYGQYASACESSTFVLQVGWFSNHRLLYTPRIKKTLSSQASACNFLERHHTVHFKLCHISCVAPRDQTSFLWKVTQTAGCMKASCWVWLRTRGRGSHKAPHRWSGTQREPVGNAMESIVTPFSLSRAMWAGKKNMEDLNAEVI
jgi:hypothetical protein